MQLMLSIQMSPTSSSSVKFYQMLRTQIVQVITMLVSMMLAASAQECLVLVLITLMLTLSVKIKKTDPQRLVFNLSIPVVQLVNPLEPQPLLLLMYTAILMSR